MEKPDKEQTPANIEANSSRVKTEKEVNAPSTPLPKKTVFGLFFGSSRQGRRGRK